MDADAELKRLLIKQRDLSCADPGISLPYETAEALYEVAIQILKLRRALTGDAGDIEGSALPKGQS